MPEIKDWICAEHRRRIEEGRAVGGVTLEARELGEWLRGEHPGLRHYVSNATIEDCIRAVHRKAGLLGKRAQLRRPVPS
jgi:hypothetical protein